MIRLRSAISRIARTQRTLPSAWAAGTLSLAHFADAFAMLGQIFITTQLLSKQQFGELGIAMAVTLLACAVFDFRVWEVMTIRIPKLQASDDSQEAASLVRGCFLLEFFGGFVVTVALLLLAPVFAQQFTNNGHAVTLFAALAVQPLLMSVDEPARTLLRLNGDFRSLAIWRSISGVFQLVLVSAALMFWPTPVSVALATMLAWCIRLTCLAWLAKRSLRSMKIDPIGESNNRRAWASIKQNRSMLSSAAVAAIAGRLANRVDLVILGWFAVPEVFAPYDLARRLTSQVSLVLEPITQVIFPKISTQLAGNEILVRNRFLVQLTSILAVTGLPVLILTILALPWGIPLVFGDSYSDAAFPSQLLMLVYVTIPILWLRPYVACSQNISVLAWAGLLTVVIQISAGLLLIPNGMAIGAAYSFLLGQMAWWACLLVIARRGFSKHSLLEKSIP
ncbi:colanic acid exporter [Rubripirellula amarantea]|uniref:Colanic acid exporter n=1 Tax=Rubripirellula amarantea TaxID=2527999 RepID=A0A5C5WRE8_9BACT|nr:oligosaccharide flippase family protein [Rubripirellula amarantea]TWT52691.1 colanic acid exporter [Rubripirellula amarantea]